MRDEIRRARAEAARPAGPCLAGAVALVLLWAGPLWAARAQHAMVVAESEAAARAGLAVLRRGGNAVDAAVATALALGVTNPASCGLGGGGFMLIYEAKTGRLYALDYRERAPLAATAAMYMRNGRPDEGLAREGGLAVAVAGEVAGLEAARERFGTMRFSELAAPAVALARNGFAVSSHLGRELKRSNEEIASDPGLSAVFLTASGKPLSEGDIIREPALAATLTSLGDEPVKNFYHGEMAERLAVFIGAHGGLVGTRDLAAYRALWREPLSRPYHGYEVWAMPPPSSGGVVLEILGMLEPGRLAGLGVNSPPYLARLIEVMRQGFVDRARYADPDFVDVPIAELLSQAHIDKMRELALHHGGLHAAAVEDHGTANLCVADAAGNVVVATTTINTAFGAKLMVPGLGVVLNDEMDDFGVAQGTANAFELRSESANAVAPGKRPLSSMTPMIVTRGGRPVLALGGSGGPMIISGVVQVALDELDFHLTPEQAAAEPRIHEQGWPEAVLVESAMPEATRDELVRMGYGLKVAPELGAVNSIMMSAGGLRGAFDARKGGAAIGY